MLFAATVVLVHALSVAYALNYAGAIQTGVVGLDPRGWSPVPTPAPYYHLYRRRLQKKDLTDTCALVNDAPLTCPLGQYCAYNSGIHFMGCCSVDAAGNFVSDCFYTTSCVDLAASSSICGTSTGCLGVQVGVCGGNTDYPECLTIVLYYGAIDSYTTYRCGPSAAFVSASVPPPSSSTTIATTPTSTPATTTTPPPTTNTPSPSRTSSSPPSTTTSPTITSSSGHSHTGAIVGGAVGGVAGVLIIAGIIGFIIYRIRVKRREAEYADDAPEIPGTAHVPK
ncbi:hypothetical protein AYL99_05537 [Fonsecaea erecta]|uniref:Mid2 domain-containing protein n=1 Tax=Fonsecaea erecta TaxID=1367422 RepID=A0A178ZNF0_9EURO|nr:hypothetical protein AYL99_05537 [Fonsecaea erecta]OAP60535.1 hypothetical protein AYL99_05537 [Fonsecaea erecta]